MTSFEKVYKAFLGKVTEDDWEDPTLLESYEDLWRDYLLSAISYFKFPRIGLDLDENETYFINDLTTAEIQILADYMKVEWLQANINTWEKIKTDYGEKDFSQANLLDKLDKTLKTAIDRALRRERNYYRSINGKPYDYSQLAGGNNNGRKTKSRLY